MTGILEYRYFRQRFISASIGFEVYEVVRYGVIKGDCITLFASLSEAKAYHAA